MTHIMKSAPSKPPSTQIVVKRDTPSPIRLTRLSTCLPPSRSPTLAAVTNTRCDFPQSIHSQKPFPSLDEFATIKSHLLMNSRPTQIISDITGTTGLSIIRAIVSGERNPIKLAGFKDGRIKASVEEIAASLTGDYRPELVFIPQQELKFYEFYQAQIAECDTQIEQCLASFADQVDVTKTPLSKPKRRGKKQPGNAPQFDLRTHLYRISGVDFTAVDDS